MYILTDSDMDTHHDLCFGDSSGHWYKRMTYYTHRSDMDAHHYTCAEIPGKEMRTNIAQN